MTTATTDEELLNPRQAAALLGVRPRTLRKWRQDGRTIPFVRLSCRAIRYRRSDLQKFIADRCIGDAAGVSV